MALLSLPNLAVLHLHQQNVPGHPDVPLSVRHRADEAHIRTCGNEFGARFMWKWGRAVQEKKAFQKLKVVGLERFRVWEGDLLRGLSLFPALSFLAVRPAGPFMIYENGRFESIESTVLEKWARLPSPRSPTGYCTDDWVESMVQATWVPQRDDFPGYDRADLSFLHNVFSRIDMTVTEKYREWYDAACVRDLQPKLGPDSSYVSILYKSPWDSDNDPDDPEYLVYNRLPDRAPSSSNSKKRPDKNEASEGNKRRVRGGRNKDIGALLGDFS